MNCATPPKKDILIQLVKEELAKKGDRRTFSVDKSHTPDVVYLVTLLGSLNPNHPIFAKDYVPDPKDRGRIGKRAEVEVPENYAETSLGEFKMDFLPICCTTLLASLKKRKPKIQKKSPRLSSIKTWTQMSRATIL